MSALQTFRASGRQPWNKTLAAHLLNRAAFGGTPEEIEMFAEWGMDKVVDFLVDFEKAPETFAAPSLPDNPPNLRAIRKFSDEEKKALFRANRESVEDIRGWWIKRMIHTQRPLQEKLTLFWHGHFATSANDVKNARHMFIQNEFLRKNCAGNFRALALGISRDPAMLKYLDNNTNRKQRPNENYARELLELFTIGIGHYSEEDVKAAARAFTGWTFRGDEFEFIEAQHDYGRKKFLGEEGDFDGTNIVDIILKQPATAQFIAKKLFAFFVDDDPGPTLVADLGKLLRSNQYELKPFLRTLFKSEVFYSPRAWRTQVKSPAQLVVGSVRMLGVKTNEQALAVAMRSIGQDLLFPPNVKGWDGGEAWINTTTLMMRYNLARYFITGDMPGSPRDMSPGPQRRALRQLLTAGTHSDLERIVPNEMAVEPAKVVNVLAARLLQAPLDAKSHDWLVDQANKVLSKERPAVVAHLIMSMPDYQLC